LQKSRILHSGDTYLVLPVDKLQTYGRWLRLMASIAIRTVARNERKLANPVAFILDEFGTIGALKAVSQAYGLMAGLNMTLWVFVQDFVQLRRDYPDDWETFIGNSQAVTCFGVMDQFTARYISDMVGTATLERISVATAEKREGGILRSGDPNYTAMADQMIPVPLMAARGYTDHGRAERPHPASREHLAAMLYPSCRIQPSYAPPRTRPHSASSGRLE
jgi:type IV secretory pathway TraG/TraD family ATPase VirD4